MYCLRATQRWRSIDRLFLGARNTFCTSIGFEVRSQLIRSTNTLLRCHAPCTVVPARLMMWETNLPKLPKTDPDKGELAYIGTISNMVKFVKTFSLSTSIVGLACQPYIFYSADQLPIWLKALLTGSLSFFIFVTPLLIHFFTSRYVLHLYYKPETGVFTAATYNIFVRVKELQFTAKDVEFPEIHGILSTVSVKNKPLFIDPSQFLDRRVYIKMMSYDKPMDWQVGSKKAASSEDHVEIPHQHLKDLKEIDKERKSP